MTEVYCFYDDVSGEWVKRTTALMGRVNDKLFAPFVPIFRRVQRLAGGWFVNGAEYTKADDKWYGVLTISTIDPCMTRIGGVDVYERIDMKAALDSLGTYRCTDRIDELKRWKEEMRGQ